MQKYITFEFLTQNNPNPNGVQYKGLFGKRSIGKTHGILKHLIKNRKENTAIMLLRRNKLELNLHPFVSKYSTAFDYNMYLHPRHITNKDDEIIMYFSALSLAEREKNSNFDEPHITDIIVDEIFAEKPNKNEFFQLQTWITTVSRKTGFSFHPITVWLIGNDDYGFSPILDGLNISKINGNKQKTVDGVYLFSGMDSPPNAINVQNKIIKKIEIKENNKPILLFSYNKQSFGVFDCTDFYYIMPYPGAKEPFTVHIKHKLTLLIMRKKTLNPIQVSNYECLKFFNNKVII